MRRAGLLGLLVVLVSGCGGGEDYGLDGERSERTLAGERAVILTPAKPNGGLVLYVHGALEDANAIAEEPRLRTLVTAALDRGWTVAASDARGDNWGTAASLEDHARLAKAVPHRRLVVLAQSMGGLDGLRLAERVDAAAVGAIYPVCDLRSVYDLGRYRDSIAEAHGPQLQAALEDLSPVPIAAKRGTQMTFWASPDDGQVPKSANTDACAAQARKAGARVEVVETAGDHGDVSNFDSVRWAQILLSAAS
jgi:hypothetical protein